jgi:starch phosphorylase
MNLVPPISAPEPVIAYFSMEVALESAIPTYSGGLGVLAGDTLRSAADLGLPVIGVTLVHRKGYFVQVLDEQGWQSEKPAEWSPEGRLEEVGRTCQLSIGGRTVSLRAWRYRIQGVTGHTVDVLLLDTDLPQNHPDDRRFTDYLYGGDAHYRLCQELVLGVGGVRMLKALGYRRTGRYHMNEGHSALLSLDLFADEMDKVPDDVERATEEVRRRCVFTTHTPVSAGHDEFPADLVRSVLTATQVENLSKLQLPSSDLNMTQLALHLSGFVNGVTKRHAALSRQLFPGFPFESITNGVHSGTWTAPSFQKLFDEHVPDWRSDHLGLRHAFNIPCDQIWEAHKTEKKRLIDEVERLTGEAFDLDAFTIGFARRATAYKRLHLLLHDPQRLRRLGALWGRIQIVYAGKAHPRDQEGKELIHQIVAGQNELGPDVRIVYLPNYDMDLAQRLTSGVDLWMNTPRPPLEASGTSGMKAAHNGVPSLSVLDGWWLEGHVEQITGWAIGHRDHGTVPDRGDDADANDLYRALEESILPLYYDEPERWRELMRFVIGLNASYFNTQRMVQEYVVAAYREALLPSVEAALAEPAT